MNKLFQRIYDWYVLNIRPPVTDVGFLEDPLTDDTSYLTDEEIEATHREADRAMSWIEKNLQRRLG
ncbi:MAG TPA: hypothetical protein VJ438_00390 [Candidatus Nanoarchaeia archaeon]|nr:hypothetical protein [Candidatus Nanoarchaeia archaeon]